MFCRNHCYCHCEGAEGDCGNLNFSSLEIGYLFCKAKSKLRI